jgi:hypothetical protein
VLTITVPGEEHYNEENHEFFTVGDFELDLEHSLVSLSKWESKFKTPFLVADQKTDEQILYYIECMIVTPNFPPEVLPRLSQENLDAIHEYIDDSMTATWFNEPPNGRRSSETITSELVYYWMFSQGIDKECEKWHLNRLFTLLKIFNLKNAKPKKMSRSEIAQRNRELNAQRRAQLQTSG